jgi:hypothetical protein
LQKATVVAKKLQLWQISCSCGKKVAAVAKKLQLWQKVAVVAKKLQLWCKKSTFVVQIQTGQVLPQSLQVLPSTPQIRGLLTFIRNRDTPRDEFIFYSERLIRHHFKFNFETH